MSNKYININDTYNQLDDFLKYYRIVLHEKYFEEVERYRVAKITRVDNKTYQFNVEMHISDVFKEKDFSSLKIISCEELAKKESIANIIWPKSENIEDPDYEITNFKEDIVDMSNFDNVLYGFVTVFVTVTLEGWTNIFIYVSRTFKDKIQVNPIIIFAYFIFYEMIGGFYLINLFLAVTNSEFEKIEVTRKELTGKKSFFALIKSRYDLREKEKQEKKKKERALKNKNLKKRF